uniref:Secreted protein n=1 Tax=Ascaris lumbricoides TaxID=6252 RepID=A0A0M3IKV8_ASCLU
MYLFFLALGGKEHWTRTKCPMCHSSHLITIYQLMTIIPMDDDTRIHRIGDNGCAAVFMRSRFVLCLGVRNRANHPIGKQVSNFLMILICLLLNDASCVIQIEFYFNAVECF